MTQLVLPATRTITIELVGNGGGGGSSSSLLTDLVSWWGLDETTGTRADAHGANDLTPANAPSFSAGKHGNAVDLESTSLQYLDEGGTSTDLQGADTDFSLVVWANAESLPSTFPTIVSCAADSSTLDYSLLYNHLSGRLEFYVNSGSTNYYAQASTFGAPSTATWYMIYCEYDGTTNTIGISVNNGTLDTAAGPSTVNSTGRFLIGAHFGAGRYWDGLVDEVAFYSRKLSADERTSMYASGAGLSYGDL